MHGVGTDPGDGTIYVAGHGGVFTIQDGRAHLVADRAQDTMGFTVAAPGRLLASGHPDLRDRDAPTHLGLIESRDRAQTWQTLSMAGEADFHALDVGAVVFGYDSLSGRLLVSDDGVAWREVWQGPAVDIAAAPDDDVALATTPTGRVLRLAEGRRPTPLVAAPQLGLLDWPAADLLVGVDADGRTWHSADEGRTWEPGGAAVGPAAALDVTQDSWLLATETALHTSTDRGETWTEIATY